MGQIEPVTQQTGMLRYDAACRALAEARAVDEVADVRAKADAMRVYAMQAKNKSLEVDAAEIRIRAERRLGQLIAEQKAGDGLNKGRAGRAPIAVDSDDRDTTPTLASAGISKDLSSRAQKLAAVPEQEFEREVSDWRGRVEKENARVTTRLEAAGERAARQEERAEPSELEQLREANAELADLVESYSVMEQGEHAMAKEMATLRGKLRVVESQRDQWMQTCNELKREVKALRRKAA